MNFGIIVPKEGATAEEIKEGAKLAGEESGRLMNKLIWRVSGWGLAGGAFGSVFLLFRGRITSASILLTFFHEFPRTPVLLIHSHRLQMGLFTGTTAGKATLATRPGVEARATKVMLQAIKESQLEMGIQESDFGKLPGGEGAGEYGQKEFSGPGEGTYHFPQLTSTNLLVRIPSGGSRPISLSSPLLISHD